MDQQILCDWCLEAFDEWQDFDCHFKQFHELGHAFCILCGTVFKPYTRRQDFLNHIHKDCLRYNTHDYHLQILRVPVAKNMKPSPHNRPTNHWIYVRGQKFYLERDDTMLQKTEQERVNLFQFLKGPALEVAPFARSPIIHFSDFEVLKDVLCFKHVEPDFEKYSSCDEESDNDEDDDLSSSSDSDMSPEWPDDLDDVDPNSSWVFG